jgi:predicted transposase/invertase (TIGR01784 family)
MESLYSDDQLFIPIISDYGFKITFGNETDTLFLRKALQALIKSKIPIREVTFVESEMKALTKDSRSGIYDIACIDENENHFIVEMQLSEYPEFIHRMKFYALYRFNTLVKKGKYTFEGLQKIYCIGILAKNIFWEIADYHNVATLQNEKGELIDDQMTFITVELEKCNLLESECQSDLEKLIFTMKNLHTITDQSQYPTFWNEEWLDKAIKELDTKAMTAEERLIYEMTISANALAVKNENNKIKAAKEEEQKLIIINLIEQTNFDDSKIAQIANTTIDFVTDIRKNKK